MSRKICPKCSAEVSTNVCKICVNCGYKFDINSLSVLEKYPRASKIWDYDKNHISPNNITYSSSKIVWWKCCNNHSWQSRIDYQASRYECLRCSSLFIKNPDLCKEWDYSKNKISPMEIRERSNKKVWWRCHRGHSWKSSISNRYEGCKCPICSGNKVLVGYNDLVTTHPELSKEVSPNSKIQPDKISYGSHKKLLWICKRKHEWETLISVRLKGNGCPYCGRRLILSGFNDLQTIYPHIAQEFDQEKNNITPYDIVCGSNKKVWWRCDKCNHSWHAKISERIIPFGSGCPKCNRSKLESETSRVLDQYNIKYRIEERFDKCKNKRTLPFDFYLPDNNVLIECQGIQHYPKECMDSIYPKWSSINSEFIGRLQKHDKIKKDFCNNSNIRLIEIKYTEINNIENILQQELNLCKAI